MILNLIENWVREVLKRFNRESSEQINEPLRRFNRITKIQLKTEILCSSQCLGLKHLNALKRFFGFLVVLLGSYNHRTVLKFNNFSNGESSTA